MNVSVPIVPVKTANHSAEEQAVRVQLAEFYHLVDYLGWTEMIFNHISARVPGPEGHYLVNPFGLWYDEITPDNLLKVDLEGNLVEPSQYKANPAGFALHSAIHTARDDMHCVVHTHTNPVTAIAMKQAGFTHDDFYGAQLFGDVGYHDFEGITVFADEKDRMLASLGQNHVLVLRNHGVAVCERNVPQAFRMLWTVQRAAEIQCQAGMLPGPNTILEDKVRQKSADVATSLTDSGGFSTMLFNAVVRKMRRERGPLWAGDTGIQCMG